MSEPIPSPQDFVPPDRNEGHRDMTRIFESLKRYWERTRDQESPSFVQILDEAEVREALQDAYPKIIPKSYEEAQAVVTSFHKDWDNIDLIEQLSPEKLKGKTLSLLVADLAMTRKLLKRMTNIWTYSIFEYRYHEQRQLKHDSFVTMEEEFGIWISDLEQFLAQPKDARENLLMKNPELEEIYNRFHIDKFNALQKQQSLIQDEIKTLTSEKPEIVKELIAHIQVSNQPIDDQMVDDVLGINIVETEQRTDYSTLREKYPQEEFYPGEKGSRWTPYAIVRTMLQELNLNDSDVLIDLGSGFGRVPIYASLATRTKCKGIEIVPERVRESKAVRDRLQIDHLDFVEGNVLSRDFSDGNVFFMFNPFSIETLEAVNETLKGIARTKKIRVVSLGPSTYFFNDQRWLKPVASNKHPWGLQIYESQ